MKHARLGFDAWLVTILLLVVLLGLLRMAVEHERKRTRILYDYTAELCAQSTNPAICMINLSLRYGGRP
jgi:hypothetical protein